MFVKIGGRGGVVWAVSCMEKTVCGKLSKCHSEVFLKTTVKCNCHESVGLPTDAACWEQLVCFGCDRRITRSDWTDLTKFNI